MGYKEKEIINKILLDGTKKGRMFRINCGVAWIGKVVKKIKGLITIKNPRQFHGAPTGTPDCIGWETRTLCTLFTSDEIKSFCYEKKQNCPICLLNKRIAIFKAVEVKTGNQKLTEEQKRFREILLRDGGIFEEARE